jgi:hypothetical protein
VYVININLILNFIENLILNFIEKWTKDEE